MPASSKVRQPVSGPDSTSSAAGSEREGRHCSTAKLCPALLVAAPASGQGKTLITAALARAWRNRGLQVRAFKCGPDFIDPMVLQTATGHPVQNLDLSMCGEQDGCRRLHRAAMEADVILVEGVMGLYDGTPSSADIAIRFGLPIALAIDAAGMAQTFGRLARGLLGDLPSAGVLANRVGSPGHAKMLQDSLNADIRWLGALPQDDRFVLPERHLGLYLAAEIHDLEQRIAAAAEALTASSQLPLPPVVSFEREDETRPIPSLLAGKTVAVARDEAFCFLYPANLESLRMLGAELVFFSPLRDAHLPPADALWLPGGYPELHAARLHHNPAMRAALHRVWQAGLPMLAECGGMMALSEAIDDQPAFGLLPGRTRMSGRLQGLGVQHVELPQGTLAAHTFHYSQFGTEMVPVAVASSRYGPGEAVYRHGSITASYLHFYFPSNPAATAALFGGAS